MWNRIIYEGWHNALPVAAFMITAAFFTIVAVRALRMGKARADQLANLPLEPERRTYPTAEPEADTDA